ncbi:MAG: DMT family transporter, partial [Clostridiales Family XIII bacterium]|nr:DMT family transporter [Clostridiales Family XIII bacterium]
MKKVTLLVICAAVLFATMEVVLKSVGNAVDPLQMTFLRFIIGGLFLLPPGVGELKRNKTRPTVGFLLCMLLLGTICVPGSMICFQLGIL